MHTILFPFGVRTSSWLCVAAFVFLAIRRRDVAPLYAGWVWLFSFEAAFDITMMALGRKPVLGGLHIYAVWGIASFALFTWKGVRPAASWAASAVVMWAVWLAVGFPVNLHTMAGFNPSAEALNEAAKALWALAYLWPFLRTSPFAGRLSQTGHGVAPPDGRRDRRTAKARTIRDEAGNGLAYQVFDRAS